MKKSKSFKLNELSDLKNLILDKTGCFFKNEDLLVQAFVRRSYASRYGGRSCEELEWIGDSVLGFYTSKILSAHYGFIKTQQNFSFEGNFEFSLRCRESHLSQIKQQIVSNHTLAHIIDSWDIMKYLIVDRCDIDNNIDKEEKVKADLFESILGAIAIQYDWNAEVLEKAVRKMLDIDTFLKDNQPAEYRPEYLTLENAVNTLKEMSEKGKCSVPVYEYGAPENLGYDMNGNPIYVCTCKVAEWGLIKQVWASSKKQAKKYASYLILCHHFELNNEYGPNSPLTIWTLKGNKLIPECIIER